MNFDRVKLSSVNFVSGLCWQWIIEFSFSLCLLAEEVEEKKNEYEHQNLNFVP
jgi:hypothetical protein